MIGCTIKTLPPELHIAAARTAIAHNPANRPATEAALLGLAGDADRVLAPGRLALLTSKYWGSGGVRLTVGFLDNPAADLRARLLSHMNAWGEFSNVKFTETAGHAQVRIARGDGGYWSFLGTDILHVDPNGPTMNLEGFTMRMPDTEFYRVVRHETGHTLGFPHEHMRREIVELLDPQRTIAYFGQNQGWSPQEVMEQVLTPIEESALTASPHADSSSIMCYQLPASITKTGQPIPGGLDIDASDRELAAKVYPVAVAPPPPPPPPKPKPVSPWIEWLRRLWPTLFPAGPAGSA